MSKVHAAPPLVNPHAIEQRFMLLTRVYRKLQATPEPTATQIAQVERQYAYLIGQAEA